MPLSGKKALVTGARRRIGRGIAETLAEAGCDVGINDIEQDEDAAETLRRIQAAGREAAFFRADISVSAQVDAMVQAFLNRFGQIDILVNNAYWAQHRPFLEIEEEAWDRTLGVCLKGCFLCSQRAARAMVRMGTGGAIVNISSVHARRVWQNDTCYGTSKAAILRLTESMAVDLAGYGIRCNAIMPGYMDTEHAFGTPPPHSGSAPERLHRFIPARRYSTPEDIGRAVAFLCSGQADTITGACLPVDGGLLVTGVP